MVSNFLLEIGGEGEGREVEITGRYDVQEVHKHSSKIENRPLRNN